MDVSRRGLINRIVCSVCVFLPFLNKSSAKDNDVSIRPDIVCSFDKLRGSKPTHSGQLIFLSGWHDNVGSQFSNCGCGYFISVEGDYQDDSGSYARVNGQWSWRRLKNVDEYTVLDFGAIPDGKTDCSAAFLFMHSWSQKLGNGYFNSPPGVVFPAGSFLISKIDISDKEINHFIIRGPFVSFGYDAKTIINTNDEGECIFITKARQIEIYGLNFDGQGANKGIINNTKILGGTFIRISNLWVRNLHSTCFVFNDTLDTKIDQFYANNCKGGVFHIGFDNEKKGNWNHSTAIELTNFNFQDCYPGMAIYAPKCLQSIIRNGWFERTNCGDLSNGQWYLENLSVENCERFGKLLLNNTRLVEVSTNQLASDIVRGYNQNTAWLKSFQPGQSVLNNNGVNLDGYVISGWSASKISISNIMNDSNWYFLGKLWLHNVGDNFKIEFSGLDLNAEKYNDFNGDVNLNLIKLRNLLITGAWEKNTLSPIEDIALVGKGNTSSEIYVKIKPGCKVGVFCRSNISQVDDEQILNWEPASTKEPINLPKNAILL